MALDIVILAAGHGTRMNSNVPKVLHLLAGKPLITHVIDVAKSLSPHKIFVIYGYEGERVKQTINDESIHWVYQEEQLGTGHAVLQALEFIEDSHDVLVLSADVPMLTHETLKKLQTSKESAPLSLLTATFENPFGLGRIIRNKQDEFIKIVEERDADEQERQVCEIYSGVMMAEASLLKEWLPNLTHQNAQKELYLTSIVEMAVNNGLLVNSVHTDDNLEVFGVNDRRQLLSLERHYQERMVEKLLDSGCSVADKKRVDIRGNLTVAKDVTIDVNVVFKGEVTLEEGVTIEPNCVISNAHIKKGTIICANSMIEGAVIGANASIGPFARIRPGTELKNNTKIGNFVEVKQAVFGEHSKASHLSYIGDAIIGEHVNIGAGTITCNYDGVNKHQTVIDDGAFIGSGTELVAPLHVGENATIGAGTTLRRNAPPEKLTLSQSVQKTVENWQRPEDKSR